jgi:hypothetical protein
MQGGVDELQTVAVAGLDRRAAGTVAVEDHGVRRGARVGGVERDRVRVGADTEVGRSVVRHEVIAKLGCQEERLRCSHRAEDTPGASAGP